MAKSGFFKAIVKDNVDKMGMGRVKVYIPAMGGDPTDETTWYTASYMSPYAGQTNPYLNEKGGKQEDQSQDSYGIWANSYHPENEVIISFVDGDESQPVLMGAMFGQNMSDSIAGYPSNFSTQGKLGGVHPPTVEYNKRDDEIHPRHPVRPFRERLTKQLWKQGLFKDFKRGQIDTGPRRDEVPQFQSFKTPAGNTFTIDDGKVSHGGAGVEGRSYTPAKGASPYIRMRTAGGTQYMMNSDCGFVYTNSGDGSSWAQISNIGVQMYTKGDMNIRAMGGYSQRSDATHNIEVMGNFNLRSVGPINTEMETGMDIRAGGDFNVYSAGFHSVKTNGGIVYQSDGNFNEQAGLAIFEYGNLILDQVKPGFAAPEALVLLTNMQQNRVDNGQTFSTVPGMSDATAQSLSGTGGFNQMSAEGATAKSAANSTVPAGDFITHEPWANQPNACGKPDTPAEEGPGENTESQPLADGTEEDAPVEGNAGPAGTPSSDPLNGAGSISSGFGVPRGDHDHGGVDLAAPKGTPIYSTGDGTVTRAGWSSSYGNVVYVDHGNGVETRYAHMESRPAVKVGQKITQGTFLGGVGNTGQSRGNHLHYEVLKNGVRTDPRPTIGR